MLQELRQLTIIASSFNLIINILKDTINTFIMVPYVISEAHPDYKRPYLNQVFGVIDENKIETFVLDKISNFVLDRTGNNDVSLQDINNFIDNYFEDCYMMNDPWSAMVFRNGEWENITPSNNKILGHIKLILLQEQEDTQKEENVNEHSEKVDTIELEESEK